MGGNGDDARQRANAERPDQDKGENNLRDSAHQLQDATDHDDQRSGVNQGARGGE
jgi:hypothetical protein